MGMAAAGPETVLVAFAPGRNPGICVKANGGYALHRASELNGVGMGMIAGAGGLSWLERAAVLTDPGHWNRRSVLSRVAAGSAERCCEGRRFTGTAGSAGISGA